MDAVIFLKLGPPQNCAFSTQRIMYEVNLLFLHCFKKFPLLRPAHFLLSLITSFRADDFSLVNGTTTDGALLPYVITAK